MKINDIFSVFSRQQTEVQPYTYSVPDKVRNRILFLCREVTGGTRHSWNGQDFAGEFWDEIHRALLYRHGRLQLTEGNYRRNSIEDTVRFLLSCKDAEFLDFVEYIFKVQCIFRILSDENALVADINEIFATESVGFELTEMIKEQVLERVDEYPHFGRESIVIKTVAYPHIIRKDSQVIHETAIKPALLLLNDPAYRSANQEFLEALEDYRNGDYGDCLTKCCSAFESVLKIICAKKKWQCGPTSTANMLVSTVIKNLGLDPYFEQPFMIIATLRNRLSSSHGAGMETKAPSQHIAQYALNSTAAAIVLLVNTAKQ